jgi:hypothetical protein
MTEAICQACDEGGKCPTPNPKVRHYCPKCRSKINAKPPDRCPDCGQWLVEKPPPEQRLRNALAVSTSGRKFYITEDLAHDLITEIERLREGNRESTDT